MDYFQELLSSYQKIKKRTFRVGYIVEQAQDPMAAYNDAARQAEALVAQGVVPISRGPKIGINGIITAYTAKTKEGIVPGLAMSDGRTPIPGSQNYAVRLSTIASDPQAQQRIGQLLLGQQETSSEQEQPNQEQQDAQQPQMDALGQPVMTPEMMADMEYQNSLGAVFNSAKNLVVGKFFKSAFENGKPITDPKTGLPKQFPWLQYGTYLQDYFISNKEQSLKRKLDESITQNGVPLDVLQKKEITDSALKFLDIGQKVNDGTASMEDLDWVKKHIITGARYSDKRSIRIKSGSSDLAVTFSWDGGQGSRKDTQFWRHMIDSYDKAVESWAENQVPKQEAEDLKIQRMQLTEMSPGSGNLENIRGVFGEDFLSIGNLINKSISTRDINPKQSEMYRLEAVKIFSAAWEKSGLALLEAFDGLQAFMGEGVAVDDQTLSELNDLKELAKVFNVSVGQAQLSGVNPEQKKKLADVLTMKLFRTLAVLDSQFAFKLGADYVATVGTNTSNGKKTDACFVFKTKEAAIRGLRNAGISDADIPNFLMDATKATTVFGGTQVADFVTKLGAGAYAVPVGIKTYIAEKAIKMGSSSAREATRTLTDTNTPQAQAIRGSLQTKYAENYGQHLTNVQEIADIVSKFDDLSVDTKAKRIPKSTVKIVKNMFEPDSQESMDLDVRLENYDKDPSSEPDLISDLNKYLQNRKAKSIVSAIQTGMRSTSPATRKAWACTLEGLLRSTAGAEEQNQITLSRVLATGQSYSVDHNAAIQELSTGLSSKKIKVVISSSGQSIQFVENCGDRKVCEEHHYASLGMSEGGFSLHLTKNNVRRLDNKFAPRANRNLPPQITAGTDLIVNFLMGQKQLLEKLLSKYQ